jgi:hypothetical protein
MIKRAVAGAWTNNMCPHSTLPRCTYCKNSAHLRIALLETTTVMMFTINGYCENIGAALCRAALNISAKFNVIQQIHFFTMSFSILKLTQLACINSG